MFKSGNAAMIINGDWSWGDYRDKVDFGIAPLPMVSSTGDFPTPLVSTKGYSINVHTTGEELSHTIALMTYLTSPDVQHQYMRRLNVLPGLTVFVISIACAFKSPLKNLGGNLLINMQRLYITRRTIFEMNNVE